ncbi:MAG: hypothetical protein Alis3KO_20670 [Aliiglaciecola sp.]|uniref:hypothetical protein n=1 Tax=Aliiglaciecola sp. M165 TaxID=2593649 RepID=UPI00117C6AB7|nr:hypothetical protein [Aliiglaciecola sp. M165]TRY31001.1 hypothetical protein FM019_14080 [Aliiglaciecola sp. M165]
MKVLKTSLLLVALAAFSLQTIAAEGARHLPEIFIGATHVDGETDFTYALEYEYKFTEKFGAGLIYERIDDGHHGDGVTLKIAALYYHPVGPVRLGLGVGEEKIGGYKSKTKDLVRVSAAYDFQFEHFIVAPTISVDFVDGEQALVFGVGFIKPF